MNEKDFILSTHSLVRFRERILPSRKFNEEEVRRELLNDLLSSVENNSWRNNTRFVTYVYEKYGTEKRHRVFESKKAVYIGIQKKSKVVIVTTIPSKETHFIHQSKQR